MDPRAIIDTAIGTVAARPYVFVFFAVFIAASWMSLGWRRTLIFLGAGYAIAFVSEFSSIRNGFPYGRYWYEYAALDPRELVVGGRPPAGSPSGTAAGVPFFDSLSYVFLAYASYELALFFASPTFVRGGADLQLACSARVRRSFGTWALATFFMGLLDVLIDPVAFLGDRFFLGKIYGYAEKHAFYFQVPLSNFLGWWLVAGATFAAVIALDRALIGRDARRDRVGTPPMRALIGPGIWLGVAAFNTTIAFWIGAGALGFANTWIALTVIVLVVARAVGWGGRATRAEVAGFEAELRGGEPPKPTGTAEELAHAVARATGLDTERLIPEMMVIRKQDAEPAPAAAAPAPAPPPLPWEFLIRRTDGDRFSIPRDKYAEILRPTSIAAKTLDGLGDHRIEAAGCEISFSYEDQGILVIFEKGTITPDVAGKIVDEVRARIIAATKQQGEVVVL